MSQNLANKLKKEFLEITNITCEATFMEKGESHKPTTLKSYEKGVYVFLLNDKTCFKVGKAGSKSPARWNSHHYNIDKSTPMFMFYMNFNRYKGTLFEYEHSL